MADLEQPIFPGEILDILTRWTTFLEEGAVSYLVGGAVRDALLGRPGRDLDFAMPFDPTPLARRFAQSLEAPWFYLDEPRCQSRVIVGLKGQGRVTCDFSPFRGESLDEDLLLRDFTINAMAVSLRHSGSPGEVYDPLGGRRDLASRQLKICSPHVLRQDALRVLKGIRHCAHLDLTIEQTTWQTMCRDVSGLAGIAGERLRDELVGILAASPAGYGLRLLDGLQAAEHLFGPPGREDGFQQALQAVGRVEALLEAVSGSLRNEFQKWLAQGEVESGINRIVVLKIAALLKGYRPFDVPGVLGRLKTGRRLQKAVLAMQALTAAQFTEFLSLACGPRGRCLWLETLEGDFVLSLIFLAILSGEANRRDLELIFDTLADFQVLRRQGRIPDLVDGRWLKKNLGLGEGPIIGQALSALRREEIAGRVVSRQEGEVFLTSFVEKIH